jgi:synaptic vesicle membrane protein VAT-1
MTAIRKVLITAFGDASNVTVVDATIDAPLPGQVQVAVEYSALSGADINMRRGVYPLQPKAPLTPGYVIVGRVLATGAGCTTVNVGQRVASLTVYGGQAERINVAEQALVPVPDGADPRQAACLVLDGNTAWHMLQLAMRRTDCRRIFIHGLSGAVGNAVATLAIMRGIAVFGTASRRHHAALRAAGATPFDYADKQWITRMKEAGGADAVFDPLGFESLAESDAVLRRGGLLVSYGFNLPALTNTPTRAVLPWVCRLYARNLRFWSGKRATFYFIDGKRPSFASGLQELLQLQADGQLTAAIKAVFPMEKIADAHRAWGGGAGMGSFVIEVAGEQSAVVQAAA